MVETTALIGQTQDRARGAQIPARSRPTPAQSTYQEAAAHVLPRATTKAGNQTIRKPS